MSSLPTLSFLFEGTKDFCAHCSSGPDFRLLSLPSHLMTVSSLVPCACVSMCVCVGGGWINFVSCVLLPILPVRHERQAGLLTSNANSLILDFPGPNTVGEINFYSLRITQCQSWPETIFQTLVVLTEEEPRLKHLLQNHYVRRTQLFSWLITFMLKYFLLLF